MRIELDRIGVGGDRRLAADDERERRGMEERGVCQRGRRVLPVGINGNIAWTRCAVTVSSALPELIVHTQA